MNLDPKLHAQAKEIFLEACELTGQERKAYLDKACAGDLLLRSEVLGLLDLHESATRDLSRPAMRQDPSTDVATRPVGRFVIGDIFADRYQIVSLLGRGGMGEVYKAQDLVLDVPVALKFLTSVNEKRLGGLLNEVRMARLVTHRNICRVYDVGTVGAAGVAGGESSGEYFLTMEYVDGEDLASLLKRIGRLPPDKLLDVSRGLCAGLAAAHARGVLHRDLKPANIILGPGGEVKITDFGIADRAGTPNRAPREIVGTPAYMAPEVLSGRGASAQSDLYSLGLLLYEMAVGKAAFAAGSITEYYDLHSYRTPEPPSRQVKDIDPDLETIILECLEKEPERRPGSALSVAARLPGSDPLRMALEAGATPSPDVVAAAGAAEPSLSPVHGGIVWVLLMLSLIGVVWASVLGVDVDPKAIRPPQVQAEHAREILHDLGYDEPVDRAWGYFANFGLEGDMAHLFWYRESPSHMMPYDILSRTASFAEVDEVDPPLLEPGMVLLRLDAAGRLVMLEAVSPMRQDQLPEPRETDWNVVLHAAGLSLNQVEPAVTRIHPQAYADRLIAWQSPDPRGMEERLHIDASSLRGRVTFFDADPEKDLRLERGEVMDEYFKGSMMLFYITILILVACAGVVARSNVRRGRGDREAALRIAIVTVLFNLIHWVLTASHVPSLGLEVDSLTASLGIILLEALFIWTLYLALEPTARRLRPQTMISWTRLLRGQWQDPLIGRSLLVGGLAGSIWATVERLDYFLPEWLGLETPFFMTGHFPLSLALDGRRPAGEAFLVSINALYAALTVLFLLAFLDRVLRRRWATIAIAGLILAVLQTFNGVDPRVSWLTFGVIVGFGSIYLLVRFGLLALTMAIFTQNLLYLAPFTLDLQVWFAGAGLFVLALVAALGTFGLWTSAQPSETR